jgi:PKD repeat protein
MIGTTETEIMFYDMVDIILAPVDPVAVGTTIAVSAPLTTWFPSESFTASWRWGDGNVSPGVLIDENVTGSHQYTSAGVYTLTLKVHDDGGIYNDETTYQYVVVYDPSVGFVTGGGWIMSPPGSYNPDPTLTGKASFGFVSKYQKGKSIPDGNTEFQFKTADFNFSSTAYDWLVVTGAKAQFKGVGTINGSGEYGFMLTAIDGQINGSDGVDKFRIKIWDKSTGDILYDNQMDAEDNAVPTTELGGGSIEIHTS